MKVFLLKTNLDNSSALEKASEVIEGLNGDIHRAGMNSGLADSDLFISDLNLVNGALGNVLQQNHHHINKRISGGGVLLCFAGAPNGSNYQWLNEMGINLQPEALVAKDINFLDGLTFSDLLKNKEKEFSHQVIFNRLPGGAFHEVAKNKSGNLVSAYTTWGNGHIFILPRPKDLNAFVSYFIDKVLPQLGVDFLVDDGSVEPMPEEVSSLSVFGEDKVVDKINQEQAKIDKAIEKKSLYENELVGLKSWKDLLWQTGNPLENIVKRFFKEFFNLDLIKTDIDLTGEYKGKELFIEVKGNTGTIDHKKDFRQIHERKFYNAKDPQNTIALLVGNPFRLLPLDQRPPVDDSLFARTSIPIAESSGIGLIHTKILFDIANEILSNPKIKKEKILEQIMNSKGVFDYKK